MAKTYCPECDTVISVDDPREGTTITCRECGQKLEIISADPFEVDYPWEEEEEE
jgi:lysine biosynthesis protein LysW